MRSGRLLVRGVLATLVAVMVLSASAAASTNPWVLVASPNHAAPQGSLLGTSCSSPTSCTAVGSALSHSGVVVPLAEQWNGTTWAIQATPRPARVPQSELTAVSCTSATACTAVGYYGTPGNFGNAFLPLVQRWDGTSWTIQNTPLPAGSLESVLSGVSCTSATACVAVGYYRTSSATATLVERWDGASWAIQSSPNVVNNVQSVLAAVSCTSPAACTAVGFFYLRSHVGTLAESWNGSSWMIQPTPNPGGGSVAIENKLAGVSCTSATACTAVGSSGSTGTFVTLAERWDGTTWTTQTTANPVSAGDNLLSGVSCASNVACTAVGHDSRGGVSASLAERWDGANWSVEATPSPPAALGSTMLTVACPSSTACAATGSWHNASGLDVTFEEAWNGSAWALQATPSPTGTQNSHLLGVSCMSAAACLAVGSFTGGSGVSVLLAERWDGTSWTIQATPLPTGAQNSVLTAVSCSSANACTAVGYAGSTGAFGPLVEQWDGTSWAIQAAPNPTGATNSVLTAVSCPTITDCAAVGYFDAGGAQATFAESWNGSSWVIHATPNPAPLVSYFTGVSCTSATSCTAVGASRSNSSFVSVTMAQRWDGSSWTIQATPNPTVIGDSILSGVSCASTTACIGTGHYNSSGRDTVLAERWDGSGWTIQTTPSPTGAQDSSLSGVTCSSLTTCTAVGTSGATGALVTLAEHWDGTSWAIQATPKPAAAHNSVLSAVTCTATPSCTAVGSSSNALGFEATLVTGS